jgi:NDP-sugar pyrophosphorylase family protein
MATTDAWVQRRLLRMRVHWSLEAPDILGTGGAVRRLAGALLSGGPAVLCNGDSILGMDLRALWAAHQQSRALGAVATLLCVSDPNADRLGAVRVSEDGLVLDLNRHAVWPGSGEEERRAARATIFCGVQVVEPSILDVLPGDGVESCIVRQGYAPLMRAGVAVRALVLPAATPFHDVGTVDRYLDAQRQLMNPDDQHPALAVAAGVDPREALFQEASFAVDASGRTYGDPGAVQGIHQARLVAPVFFGPGNRVDPGAVLGPDCSLGAMNRIGRGAVIRDSALWSQVEVAAGERVDGELRARLGGEVLRARRAVEAP